MPKLQDVLFDKSPPASGRIEFLEGCPWLYGSYKNKLWRHPLHAVSSYASKLRPQIAYFFIEQFSNPGDKILDPFSGSGTVCLEACLNGRVGIGVDLSPYAYILTRIKVDPPDPSILTERVRELETTLRFNELPILDNIPESVKAFFHPTTLAEIVAFRMRLDIDNKNDSALLALLCGILHGGRPGFLSRRTRDLIPLKPSGPVEYRNIFPLILNKINRVYSRPLDLSFKKGIPFCADSRNLEFIKDHSIDLVVTSPPFFETTEFVRHNWLRLWLIGWDLETQKERARLFVGERNTSTFAVDLKDVLNETSKKLKAGGRFVIHAGKKYDQNMTEIIVEFGENTGYKVESIIDERKDHTSKHALRRISGLSHDFVVLRGD